MNENFNSDSDIERYQVWELVSFKNQETDEIVNNLPESEIPKNHRTDTKYAIYSVKRTTDDKIFTVGDTVGLDKDSPIGEIKWMFVSFEQLRIDTSGIGIPLTDDITII